ncbi:hypothetical protein FTX61_19530 [Nitriliruptoraceae bacterium ZYF776]|nr:hypothetical protein [Profundirhabdus halotolerans]
MTTARRWLTVPLSLFLVALGATPAAADPAGPTNYRSTIEDVEPTLDSVDIDILGGDAFIVLTADPGITVTVPGYNDEPYLQFLPDGTVQRNAASPARWLNDARYGGLDVTVPPEASADAPPRWEPVADDGTYAWHDHRVHWMSPAVPRQVDTGAGTPQPVQDWSFQITVDEQPVAVSGQLTWFPPASPLLPALAFLIVGAGATALVLRRSAAATAVAAVGAVAAAVVGTSASVGLPSGAQAEPATFILPLVALVLAGVAVTIRRRPGSAPRVLGALAGVPVVVWGVLQSGSLTAPIVPTPLPAALARSLIAVALAAGLAALVGAGRSLVSSGTDAGPTSAGADTNNERRPRRLSRRVGHHASAVLVIAGTQPFLVAHAGEGATWQALLVVLSLGCAVVFGLVLVGRVRMSEPDDLVLPLAGVAIVSSLAPLGSNFLSDWVGWAFPIGVVALVALIVAAVSPLALSFGEPATYGAVAIAAIGAVTLQAPITRAWHPPPEFLPLADDVEIAIVSPQEGGELSDGVMEVTVAVTGGTLGPGGLTLDQLPTDPEQSGELAVALDGESVEPDTAQPCTIEVPCSEVTFPLEVDPGEHTLAVEFRRGDGVPFTPLVTDRITFITR